METQFNDYGKLQFAFRYVYLLSTELGERRQKNLHSQRTCLLSPYPHSPGLNQGKAPPPLNGHFR